MAGRPYLGSFELMVLLAVIRLDDAAYGVTISRTLEAGTGREIATALQGRWPRSAVNPEVLPRTNLSRWQPYPMNRGPNR